MKIQLNTVLKSCFAIAVVFCIVMLPMQLSASDESDIAGVYVLISVDGKAIPASINHEGVSMEIRSGSFTIKADGSCSSKMIFSVQSRPEMTREVSATYKKEGSKLSMQWKGAGKTTGTLEGNTFTMNNEGMVLIYRK